MSDLFILTIGTPAMAGGAIQPVLNLGLDAQKSQLAMSWDAHGPAGATLSLVPVSRSPIVGRIPSPIDIPLRGHAEIRVGETVVWEGFVRRRRRDGRTRDVTALTLVGYSQSLGDNWWSRADLTSSITSGAALRASLSELAPWMVPGVVGDQWIDPQVVHSGGMAEFGRMTVAQIIDQIEQEGDSRGRRVSVMCMPGRRVWLRPWQPPQESEYLIAFDNRVASWEDSDEGMAATVTVERSSGDSTALGTTASNAGFLSSYGFGPSVLIPAGEISEDAAIALRNAELQRRAVAQVRATLEVTNDPRTWLARRYGAPVPWWQPRPGEWVQVADEPALPIVGVTVRPAGATYELGAPDPSLSGRQLLPLREAAARWRNMLAPTGGRLR